MYQSLGMQWWTKCPYLYFCNREASYRGQQMLLKNRSKTADGLRMRIESSEGIKRIRQHVWGKENNMNRSLKEFQKLKGIHCG